MTDKCDTFNDYFVSIGSILSSSIPQVSLTSYQHYLPNPNDHCMFLHPTDGDELKLSNVSEISRMSAQDLMKFIVKL